MQTHQLLKHTNACVSGNWYTVWTIVTYCECVPLLHLVFSQKWNELNDCDTLRSLLKDWQNDNDKDLFIFFKRYIRNWSMLYHEAQWSFLMKVWKCNTLKRKKKKRKKPWISVQQSIQMLPTLFCRFNRNDLFQSCFVFCMPADFELLRSSTINCGLFGVMLCLLCSRLKLTYTDTMTIFCCLNERF